MPAFHPIKKKGLAMLRLGVALYKDFELLDVYDFWYDIDEPQVLNDVITDSVFILRKK